MEKMRMRKVPLTQQSKGLRRCHRAKNAVNADSKTWKMQKMRLTGFIVTGSR